MFFLSLHLFTLHLISLCLGLCYYFDFWNIEKYFESLLTFINNPIHPLLDCHLGSTGITKILSCLSKCGYQQILKWKTWAKQATFWLSKESFDSITRALCLEVLRCFHMSNCRLVDTFVSKDKFFKSSNVSKNSSKDEMSKVSYSIAIWSLM